MAYESKSGTEDPAYGQSFEDARTASIRRAQATVAQDIGSILRASGAELDATRRIIWASPDNTGQSIPQDISSQQISA